MKNTSKTKMVQKLFSISPRHFEMINELLENNIFTSQSDVIRQAIVLLYDIKIKKTEGAKPNA